ncbi:hypothetical protein HMI55_003669 [Coelomomyces lativittatus]|nr:hypothetical protein HMI55_003669 [Coelomomyces lativittatus]
MAAEMEKDIKVILLRSLEANVPCFSGIETIEGVKAYLFKLEQLFSATEFNDILKIQFSVAMLTGNAALWYQDLSKKNSDVKKNWSMFEKEFRSRFISQEHIQVYMTKLETLRQTGSMEVYLEAFKNICRELQLPQEIKVHYLLRGLNNFSRQFVASDSHNLDTCENLESACRRYDIIMGMEKQSYGSQAFMVNVDKEKNWKMNFKNETGSKSQRFEKRCFHCNKIGHIARFCRNRNNNDKEAKKASVKIKLNI